MGGWPVDAHLLAPVTILSLRIVLHVSLVAPAGCALHVAHAACHVGGVVESASDVPCAFLWSFLPLPPSQVF